MNILLRLMGGAFILMWALGLFFRIPGIFVWFLLGFGLITLLLSTRLQEDM